MLSRTVLGAVTGVIAGFGFLFTLTLTARYCNGGPRRALCGETLLLQYPLQFLFWVAVAGMLVVAGFRFLRQRRGWWVAGSAAVLWLVLVLATGFVVYEHLDLYQAERGPVLVTAALTAAGVSYAIAALCVGRPLTGAVGRDGR
ncbi:hypothetical protein GCM10011609_38140 [Lentzea pudingi]|uniref:Uncharacterized protein n=1 Tax=Lentzea pudingi TaxID=1789439 RepID=A0ABQ2I2S8_9PSEU|nr:hypothetical protein [Lentzea pudingi]GGM96746.1 hypothetical protein GCM10011609_38140 [Lentzea pudingi]